MKVDTCYSRPSIPTFLKYVCLASIPFIVVALVYAITTGHFFTKEGLIWKLSLPFYPLGIATGVAIGTRQYILTITNVENILGLNEWLIDYLIKAEYNILSFDTETMTLTPQQASKRLLRSWFPSEVVLTNSSTHELRISGPYKIINLLEVKLRFGKVSVR